MIIATLRSTAFTLSPAKDFVIGNLLILPLPAFSRRLHNSFSGLYLYGSNPLQPHKGFPRVNTFPAIPHFTPKKAVVCAGLTVSVVSLAEIPSSS
jgi:hypothetical protein